MLNFVIEVNGVTYNAIDDWNCYLRHKRIGKAEPKYKTINVPYRDGLLFVSESFGGVAYGNRIIELQMLMAHDDPDMMHSEICNAINGQKCKIWFLSDQDWYYEGRVTVDDYYTEGSRLLFTIFINADPYKYMDHKLVFTSPSSVVCKCGKMKSIPTIKTTATVTAKLGSVQKSLTAGTYTDPDYVMSTGNNTFTFTGSATITLTYREGNL